MATKILLKKSLTAGSVPLISDLDAGELAVNLVDRKIYSKDGSGAIQRLDGAFVSASTPSNPTEGDLWYDTTNNQLKVHNGTGWDEAGYQNLADLEDVSFSSLTSGDHITYNGTSWTNSNFESDVEGLLSAANTGTGHGDLSYSNGVFTFDRVTAGEIRSEISVTDDGGDGALSYNPTTGVITYTGPSAAEVQAHLTGGTGITHSAGDISIDFSEFNTDSLVEGTTNLFHTEARSRASISVTDNGGDGSLSYNSTNGEISFTGPSATEVRAHFSGGTGVSITGGVVAIGQAVGTSDTVQFTEVQSPALTHSGGTITIDPTDDGANTGEVIIAGNLTVNGTTTSVNSNEVNIGDAIIILNADETGTASQNAGIEIERGTDANKSFIWDETNDAWTLNNESLIGVVLDGGSY